MECKLRLQNEAQCAAIDNASGSKTGRNRGHKCENCHRLQHAHTDLEAHTMRTKGVLLLSRLMLKRQSPNPKADMLSFLTGTTPDSGPCLADKRGL